MSIEEKKDEEAPPIKFTMPVPTEAASAETLQKNRESRAQGTYESILLIGHFTLNPANVTKFEKI